jgi:hypothetical protein
MDVRLSPEQQALRDSAAAMMDHLGVRAVVDLQDSERAAKLDAAVASSGWRELRTPAGVSQPGQPVTPVASAVEAAIIAEELGRGLADAPFLGPTLAAELRRLAGAPPAAGPETVVLRSDVSAPASWPAEDAVAIDAQRSESALVLQPAAGGWTLARVEVGPTIEASDLTRSVSRLAPGGRSSTTPVGGELTEADVQACISLGRALVCADLVGVMRGVIGLTTAYASFRRQFGAPIGSFQAVQHLLADACVAIEGSRSVALHAAWAVDALPAGDALFATSVAKAYCARAARGVCETGIQVHGGIGNTWDCPVHVFLRRALLSIDLFGGVGANLDRVLAHHGIGERDGLR